MNPNRSNTQQRLRNGDGAVPRRLASRRLVASLKGLRRVGEPYFGVAELLEKRASALSLGQRQRVSLASAWLGAPPLLILDEPTNGLDVQTQQEVIARLAESSALIATHDRAFADAVATRFVVMRSGQLESR